MKRKSLWCAVLGLMLLLGLWGVLAGEAAAEGENIQMSVVSEPAEGGTIAVGDREPAAADVAYVPKGSTVTLTACPAEGWRLAYWTYTPYALGTIPMGDADSLSYTPYAPSEDTVYTAHFIPTSTKASAAFVDNAGNAITEIDLGVETVGYTSYVSRTDIRIGATPLLKNTGDCILAPAGFRLDEEGKKYFGVSRVILNPDGLLNRSATLSTWRVYPQNGLEPGVYEGTVTFVEHCQPGLSEPVSVKVKFEVTEDAIIRTRSSSQAGGTTTGDGRYKKGETVTLTAVANEHYAFKKWWYKGSGRYTENPLVLEAGPDIAGTYEAEFTLCDSHIIVNCEGEGRVLLEGQAPADSYDLWIPVGESLTATAVPAEGWRLAYWKNAAGTVFYGEPGSLEYKTQGAITAVFISRDVKTSVELADGAELLDLGTASEGYTAYIPNTNYTYMTVNIKKNVYVRNTGECMIPLKNGYLTMTGRDADCFHVTQQYLNKDSYLNPRDRTHYPYRIYPENGLPEGVYEATITFVERCQGGINPPAGIPVRFEVTKAYEITAQVEGNQGGKVTGAGFCPAGEGVTLTAVPEVNFVFDHWTREDGSTSTENPLTFVPAAKETVTAHFRRTGYSVRVSADPAAGGSITDGKGDPAVSLDNQPDGTAFTFTAVPAEGYLFGYWTDNGNVIAVDAGTEATVTVTANPDHTLAAHFLKPALGALNPTATGVRATVTAPAGAVLAAVSYDGSGRLADIKTVVIGASCVEKNYDLAISRGSGTVKLFLLESFESCKPLCMAK